MRRNRAADPRVGEVVHYVRDEFIPECHTALVLATDNLPGGHGEALSYRGEHGAAFNLDVRHVEPDGRGLEPLTWHYPHGEAHRPPPKETP